MIRPRAILFDHDGVLVDSEPLHAAAWHKLLQEMGLPYRPGDLRSSVGGTAPQTLTRLLDLYRPGWLPSEFDLEALAARKNEFYLKSAHQKLLPYPGVLEGLQWLRSLSIRTAVVSNARRRELLGALGHLGLSPYFDAIISREDAGAAKPDPAPYLLGAASVGILPQHCMAVEDSPTGLEAALTARIPAAAITSNFIHQDLVQPVPGRPGLSPVWIGPSTQEFFDFIRSLS